MHWPWSVPSLAGFVRHKSKPVSLQSEEKTELWTLWSVLERKQKHWTNSSRVHGKFKFDPSAINNTLLLATLHCLCRYRSLCVFRNEVLGLSETSKKPVFSNKNDVLIANYELQRSATCKKSLSAAFSYWKFFIRRCLKLTTNPVKSWRSSVSIEELSTVTTSVKFGASIASAFEGNFFLLFVALVPAHGCAYGYVQIFSRFKKISFFNIFLKYTLKTLPHMFLLQKKNRTKKSNNFNRPTFPVISSLDFRGENLSCWNRSMIMKNARNFILLPEIFIKSSSSSSFNLMISLSSLQL